MEHSKFLYSLYLENTPDKPAGYATKYPPKEPRHQRFLWWWVHPPTLQIRVHMLRWRFRWGVALGPYMLLRCRRLWWNCTINALRHWRNITITRCSITRCNITLGSITRRNIPPRGDALLLLLLLLLLLFSVVLCYFFCTLLLLVSNRLFFVLFGIVEEEEHL